MKKITCVTQEGKHVSVSSENIVTRTSSYGILVSRGKALVIQAHLSLWEFPGGANEAHESIQGGLMREMLEETGYKVKIKKFILERESFYVTPSGKTYHSFQHFFQVISEDKKNTASASNLKNDTWIPLKDLNKKNMNMGAYTALRAFLHNKTPKHQFLPQNVGGEQPDGWQQGSCSRRRNARNRQDGFSRGTLK